MNYKYIYKYIVDHIILLSGNLFIAPKNKISMFSFPSFISKQVSLTGSLTILE